MIKFGQVRSGVQGVQAPGNHSVECWRGWLRLPGDCGRCGWLAAGETMTTINTNSRRSQPFWLPGDVPETLARHVNITFRTKTVLTLYNQNNNESVDVAIEGSWDVILRDHNTKGTYTVDFMDGFEATFVPEVWFIVDSSDNESLPPAP